MRRMMMCCLGFLLCASLASASEFTPTPMTLSATDVVEYAFGGQSLNVNFSSNLPGTFYFVVSTKGKASSIVNVVNGFKDWHQVSKIDTCLFVSGGNSMNTGANSYVWDGRDESGNVVSSDSLTYYLWAVDTQTARLQATKGTIMMFGPQNYRTILTQDSLGVDLARPIVYVGAGTRTTLTTMSLRTNRKWIIGSDPLDSALCETCLTRQSNDVGGLYFHPGSGTIFYKTIKCFTPTPGIAIRRHTWQQNAEALQTETDLAWGDVADSPGEIQFATNHEPKWYMGGLVSDGTNMWISTANTTTPSSYQSELLWVDVETGVESNTKSDLASWWVDLASYNAYPTYAVATGGPLTLHYKNGRIALGCHGSCMDQVVDPYGDPEEGAFFLWTNRNGDGIGDKHNASDDSRPWLCNDNNVGPYKYNLALDKNNFSVFPCYYDSGSLGSFGLFAPDGTGIAYVSLAGETAYQKYGTELIHYGSAYDGMYTTSNVSGTGIDSGFYFVGQDSFAGTIVPTGAVNETAPAAFSVAQNTPNPFNPTTTITFTLSKAGKTTVEVFNAAGQKVDTIVNGSMSAGPHSVTWNAAKFSAGVYFYTVKSGSLSKTMKMTLLK